MMCCNSIAPSHLLALLLKYADHTERYELTKEEIAKAEREWLMLMSGHGGTFHYVRVPKK